MRRDAARITARQFSQPSTGQRNQQSSATEPVLAAELTGYGGECSSQAFSNGAPQQLRAASSTHEKLGTLPNFRR